VKENPISTDARHSERLRKLGREPHFCSFCGVNDPLVLIPKSFRWLKNRVHRSVLEKHHVLAKNRDDRFVVLLCRNCHAMVTEGYLQAGVELRREPNPRKRTAHMLKAQAVFLRQLAERNCQWATDLSASDTCETSDGK
jgi:hypothetical protein